MPEGAGQRKLRIENGRVASRTRVARAFERGGPDHERTHDVRGVGALDTTKRAETVSGPGHGLRVFVGQGVEQLRLASGRGHARKCARRGAPDFDVVGRQVIITHVAHAPELFRNTELESAASRG